MYAKHFFRTCTREAILHVHIWPTVRFRVYRGGVLAQLARKTYHIYMHSDPNSACTQNTPDLHALEPQFFMYAKHARPTYTIDPIIYVRGIRLAYTRATTNWLTRRGARPTPLAGLPTILLRNNKKNQPEAGLHAQCTRSLCRGTHPHTLCHAQRSPQG